MFDTGEEIEISPLELGEQWGDVLHHYRLLAGQPGKSNRLPRRGATAKGVNPQPSPMPIDADLDLQFVADESRQGAMQMALEEVAARRVSEGGAGLVRVFSWEPSTLSMGYGQATKTVDWAFCEVNGIDVTRRQTGGGGIYHDARGDISYSIVVPREAVSGDLLESYHTLCEPIIEFFHAIGIDASFADEQHDAVYAPACFLRDIHPAHDILVEGKKISGNAQYRQRDAVIQHGSIISSQAIDSHLGVFAEELSTDLFQQRVTSVDEHVEFTRAEVVVELEQVLRSWSGATEREWTADELTSARRLAEKKYTASSWIERS